MYENFGAAVADQAVEFKLFFPDNTTPDNTKDPSQSHNTRMLQSLLAVTAQMSNPSTNGMWQELHGDEFLVDEGYLRGNHLINSNWGKIFYRKG